MGGGAGDGVDLAQPARPGFPARALLALLLGATVATGCSNRLRKLSTGGGPAEALLYDVLGDERSPTYYYDLVRSSHDAEDFRYRCGDDPYLVDKSVDAIRHLGEASYARLEGQAQVVSLLTEILLEDRPALARAE